MEQTAEILGCAQIEVTSGENRKKEAHRFYEAEGYAQSQRRSVKDKFAALKDLSVGEFCHLNGSLESHLLGTFEILTDWENPEFVCDAGLYHASYGTQPMKKWG